MKTKSVIKRAAAALMVAVVFALTGIPHGSAYEVETVFLRNAEPIAENMDIHTYRDTAVAGKFAAVDPEGEAVTFEIVTQPKRGSVSILAGGEFIYTPDTTKSKDSFTYTAKDESGNVSAEATVTIHIIKQKNEINYADTEDAGVGYEAIALSEAGVYTGEKVGDFYFFHPDKNVTYSEFLAMCLSAADTEVLENITRTGLDNDNDIPTWAKGYISTAILTDTYTGGKNFSYSDNITFKDAAVMIDSTFEITDVVGVSAFSQDLDSAASQAMANLYACRIIDETAVGHADKEITMADAARLLCRAMEIAENR